MDIKCYCSSIKQYDADIKALNSACASLENAGDQLYKLINQATSYAESFGSAATPENLGTICTKIGLCGKKPYLSINQEIDELDDIIKNLKSSYDSMVKADKQYHANAANAANPAPNTMQTGQKLKLLYDPEVLAAD